MFKVTIRRATRKDCSSLLELVRRLAEYQKASKEVVITPEEFEQAGFDPGSVWESYVAEYKDCIIGFALYYTRFSTWKGCRLYLEDIYIEPEYRRTGIGKLLFETLMERTRELGFSGMEWQALDWNEAALKFYEHYDASFDKGRVNCSIEIKAY